jgi:hypothetical protein
MNRIIIFLSFVLILSSCRGRGSGPLQTGDAEAQTNEDQVHTGTVNPERVYVTIDPCSDCIKISELYKDKKTYSGKTIEVKGIATKFNPEIMDKNWVHIQDGSEYKDSFDLTITTEAIVQVGDTVTFKGRISLEKDFGFGYYYPVLMEEAVPVN